MLLKILDFLEKRLAAKAGVAYGDGWHDPELASALPSVHAGDIATGLSLLATDDPHLRAVRVDVLSEECVPLLEKLESELDGGDPDLLLWAATTRLRAAWDVRTGAWAEDVGEERFARFHAMLDPVFESLSHAAELSPRPDAWNWFQWFGLAVGLPREQLDQTWERIVSLAPGHVDSLYTRMQVLCHKWQGSHEEMFSFARDVMLDARPGEQTLELLPRAHIERFTVLLREAEPETYGQIRVLAQEYFGDRAVMGEVAHAADLWLRGGPDHPRLARAAHSFGAVLHLGGQEDLAARALSLAGRRVPKDSLWAHAFPHPPADYVRARRRLGVPL